MKPMRKNESGFTMVELLVTMLLLTIALVGLAGLQLYSVRQVTASKRANEATRLGQAVLESYMVGPAPALQATWDHPLNRDGAQMKNVQMDGVTTPGPFSVYFLAEDVGTPPVRLVTVKVTWQESPPGATPAPTARTLEVVMSIQRQP